MNIKPGNRVPGTPNEYTVGGFSVSFCIHSVNTFILGKKMKIYKYSFLRRRVN